MQYDINGGELLKDSCENSNEPSRSASGLDFLNSRIRNLLHVLIELVFQLDGWLFAQVRKHSNWNILENWPCPSFHPLSCEQRSPYACLPLVTFIQVLMVFIYMRYFNSHRDFGYFRFVAFLKLFRVFAETTRSRFLSSYRLDIFKFRIIGDIKVVISLIIIFLFCAIWHLIFTCKIFIVYSVVLLAEELYLYEGCP
jgi:hypothetical protein